MKPNFYLVLLLVLVCTQTFAQSVDEILRNARVLNRDDKIFLRIQSDNSLQWSTGSGNSGVASNYLPYDKNHAYFLVRNNAVNVYIRPVNPLNQSVDVQLKYSADSLSIKMNAAAEIFKTKFSFMDLVVNLDGKKPADCEQALIDNFDKEIKTLGKNVQQGNIKAMTEVFGQLKSLTFEDKNQTSEGIKKASTSIEKISAYYHTSDSLLTALSDAVKQGVEKCPESPTLYLLKNSFYNQLSLINTMLKAQELKLAHLKKAYSLTKEMYDEAARHKDNTIEWCVLLKQPDLQDGKITNIIITLHKSGYELTPDSDFIATKATDLSTYTLQLKKFEHFVPEVAAGIVYSNLAYDTFGTSTDAAGNMVVANTKNSIAKFSVSTMMNFNYYIPNSPIHPFLQVGVGTNTDYQALFLGVGLRNEYLHGVTFSFGGASPWLKSLKTLKVGDKVTGTNQINSDLTTDIYWFRKVYFGIQLKL